MNSMDYLLLVERDATVVNALCTALRAMRLINGSIVDMAGENRPLQLEGQMLQIHKALLLLNVDSDEVGYA
jgi:hypothetical protein